MTGQKMTCGGPSATASVLVLVSDWIVRSKHSLLSLLLVLLLTFAAMLVILYGSVVVLASLARWKNVRLTGVVSYY